jgi:hypothetical protein
MKRTITRLGWFIGIWAASVTALYAIAYVLRKIILG